MINKIYGTPFQATTSGSTTAVATQSASTGEVGINYITDIAGSSDLAGATLTVKQGSTTIWQVQLSTTAVGNNSYSYRFETPLKSAVGATVSVTVTGTSACYANIAGLFI